MKFKKALQSSRAICFLLMVAILAGMLFRFKPMMAPEYWAYDLMSGFRPRAAGTPVIVVAIDDNSLKRIGDWPWPRSYIADIIDTLSKNGARALGVSILYRNRELNEGLIETQNL
jgi:CHASE2 domain-containing sensor protein